MKKLIVILLLLQICFDVFAQKTITAKKELKKTGFNFTIGLLSMGAAGYCMGNAFEAHNKFVFNYNRGYPYDMPEYQKVFKNQMFLSIGFAAAGVILDACAVYHFIGYRTAMEKKITFWVKPIGVGVCYSLR